MPCLSSADARVKENYDIVIPHISRSLYSNEFPTDTVPKTPKQKQQELDSKKKIKEVAKAKPLPKPEKVDESGDANSAKKAKPKRQRRPPGMERPPEIPRRNGN